MGWVEESGRHDGYVVPVFADGRRGSGTSGAGGWCVAGQDGLDQYDAAGNLVDVRPAAAVIGWQVLCTHAPAYVPDEDLGRTHHRHETWSSPVVWRRVYSSAEQDLDQHLIYASLDDEGSVDIGGRGDLEELLIAEWRTHIEPEDHARSIRDAVDAINQAQQTLDLEVAAARASGMSWAEIGRAARVTRQAARERWGVSNT